MSPISMIKADYKGKYAGAEIRSFSKAETSELSPCPICESKRHLRMIYTFLGSDYRQIACIKCLLYTNLFNYFASKDDPKVHWNSREIFRDE